MDTNDIQRVVIAKLRLEIAGRVTKYSSTDANKDRGDWPDKTGGGRDGNQTGHGAAGCSQDRGLASGHPLGKHPGQSRCRSRSVGSDKGTGGKTIRCKSAPGVKAEPTDPKQRGADHTKGKVVG